MAELPFAGEGKDIDLVFAVRRQKEKMDVNAKEKMDMNMNVFSNMNLKKEKKKKKKKKEDEKADEDNSYYKETGGSSVAPPNEPLNILMIHHASMYKVDGSNTIEPVVGLESFKDGLVLGSFNGLVALYRTRGDFCLLNPSTGKVNLVNVDIGEWDNSFRYLTECVLYGLCHDSDTDEYKAVNFYSGDHRYNVVNFKHKERSIRKTKLRLPHFTGFPSGPIGTVVKGVPYWICTVPLGCLIYYFDSKTEEFLMGPVLPNRSRNCRLGTLDGKLTASFTGTHTGTEFWTLDDHKRNEGNCCSWSLLFVFPELLRSVSTLSWMTSQGEVLALQGDNRFIVFNVKEKRLQLLSRSFQIRMNERYNYNFTVAYIPSLIDP